MVIMNSLAVNGYPPSNADDGKDCSGNSEVIDEEGDANADDGSDVKKELFFQEDSGKRILSCEICSKNFRQSRSYLKHKQLYPFRHKHYKCCDGIGEEEEEEEEEEEDDDNHECHRQINSRISVEDGTDAYNVNVVADEYGGETSDEEPTRDPLTIDPETPKDPDGNDESRSEGPSDAEEEMVALDEIFGKRKRSYKRKTETEKLEEEKMKVFRCEECLKSFNKRSSLTYHVKVVHEKECRSFKCKICDEEFASKEAFRAHASMHGPEDKVVCKGCKKAFDSLKLYHAHAKQYPGVHCFLCKLCLRKFPSEHLLEQHVCICQNGKPLRCACGQHFTKYQDVIAHSKGTKPFHCCSCSHLSMSLTTYIRHLRKHSKQKPYQCTKCDMKFAIIDFLRLHNLREHKEEGEGYGGGDGDGEGDGEGEVAATTTATTATDAKAPETREQETKTDPLASQTSFKCPSCGEKFATAEDFKKHHSLHERVQCPDCGKMFKWNRLENHRNTHKKSASLCPECGKLFDARFKLTQHMITIHSAVPVKCDVCQKVLKTKKILNEHMKTHLKTEVGNRVPQAICPRCGLGLAQKGSLARHILLVHEKHKIVPCNKTYTCQECSEVLPNKGKYYSHRRMHKAMVDRFPCEICGRVFNKKQNLRRHIYLLHDERRVIELPIYNCQICARSFREKKNLRRHCKVVHKMDDMCLS